MEIFTLLAMVCQVEETIKITMAQIFIVFLTQISCCCCSVTKLCSTHCDPINCSTPGFPVLHHLLELAQVHAHCIGDAIQPPPPLLPSIFPSIRDFSSESSVCIRWPKYWSFSFSISPSSEYLALLPLKIDWFDLLLSKEISGVFSSTTVQRLWFFVFLPSLWSSSHNHTWPLGRP